MEEIKRHLLLFPEHIKNALENFTYWDKICEIRLRRNQPLSLTSYEGNIVLNEKGEKCSLEQALCCTEEDLRHLLGSFCGGCVYRYFHQLSEGFAVDDDGWRLGLCSEKESFESFLPEKIFGINLRIPRFMPDAANDLIPFFQEKGLFSTLILSAPGNGKTTLLRALALALSSGALGAPLRVCVIDERKELFPKTLKNKGLIDLLSGYDKKTGVEMAVRLFSPQVILCDEIGNEKEVSALLSSCTGGCKVIASCHAERLKEAEKITFLKPLISSGLFQNFITLYREPGRIYARKLFFEELK